MNRIHHYALSEVIRGNYLIIWGLSIILPLCLHTPYTQLITETSATMLNALSAMLSNHLGPPGIPQDAHHISDTNWGTITRVCRTW